MAFEDCDFALIKILKFLKFHRVYKKYICLTSIIKKIEYKNEIFIIKYIMKI